MDLPLYPATLPGSYGLQTTSCTPPHCWGTGGSGSPPVHSHSAGEQWTLGLLLYTTTLLGGSGQRISFNMWPQCRGAVGGGSPLYTATLLGSIGGVLMDPHYPVPPAALQCTEGTLLSSAASVAMY